MTKIVKTAIHFSAKDLRLLLHRSLNTLEPQDAPDWSYPLADQLRDTDEIILTVVREVAEKPGGASATGD